MTYTSRDRNQRLKRTNPGVRSPQIWELDRTEEGPAATITYTRWDERYLVEVPGDTPRVFNRWINAAAMAMYLVDTRKPVSDALPPAELPVPPPTEPPKVRKLGRFQKAILEEVKRLDIDAHPIQITQNLSVSLHRPLTYVQVYVALRGLEQRGLVTSVMVTFEPKRKGGCNRKRIFKIEARGRLALESNDIAKERGNTFFYAVDSAGKPHRHGGTRRKLTHCVLVFYVGRTKPIKIWTESLAEAKAIEASCHSTRRTITFDTMGLLALPVNSVEILEAIAPIK